MGQQNVLTDSTSREEYSRDMAEYEGYPAIVVKPATEGEIAEIVKLASRTLTPILARGAGSSLTGAAVLQDGIVIDMKRMNKVIKIDPINW